MEARQLDEAFSMAAFLAFLELCSYSREHPSLTDIQASISLVSHRSGASGLDFRGGLALRKVLDTSVDWEMTPDCLRRFAFEWIRATEPGWLHFFPYGRESVRRTLNDDQAQCFREAGLLEETPDDETIRWWDQVAALTRGLADFKKMEQARLAERWSFEHEQKRVKDQGIGKIPKWVSIEDNSLGYDILSYDLDSEEQVVTKLVEVKSKLADHIFLTRNEWESAAGAPQATVVHVWDMPTGLLCEYRPWEIEPNIPLDQGAGIWQVVRIALEETNHRTEGARYRHL